MEKGGANSPFSSKMGAGRFGVGVHVNSFPTSNPTLLIRSMFTVFEWGSAEWMTVTQTPAWRAARRRPALEDVLPEVQNVGKVIQFKISCNVKPQLRAIRMFTLTGDGMQDGSSCEFPAP